MKYEKGSFILVPNKHSIRGELASVQCVYLWLCDHSNVSGLCFPSIKTLAEEAGCSERTVDSVLKRLCELGVITKESRYKDNEQTTNLYQINIVSALGSATIAPPLAQPLRTELNPVLTQSNTSEIGISQEVYIEEENPRKKPESKYPNARSVFSLWEKYPKNWESNTTQLRAAENLFEEHGLETLGKVLRWYKRHKDIEFCPQITSPYDLDSKFQKLEAFKDKL